MDKKFIITIGRQLGSGGRSIANLLAEHYGITAYDRKVIEMAAQESGLSAEFFENADEKKWHGFFHAIFSNRAAANALGSNENYLSNDALFKMQSDTIRDLAERESCIFVGRCADYILRDHPCHINLFFTADLADRVSRIAQEKGITEAQATELIEKTDRRRATYYGFYTGGKWGKYDNYHLALDSAALGIDGVAELIAAAVKKRG